MKLEYKLKENEFYNVKEVAKSEFQISDRLLAKLKRNKKIFLNGTPCYVTNIVKKDDIVLFDLDFDEITDNIVPKEINLNIIFEDDAFLILNKPANIAIHPSQSHYDNSLSNGVKFYFNKLGLKRKIRPVNRLDKDTSRNCYFCKK